MKVIKLHNETGPMDVLLEEKNKRLSFIFGGNGDLYWNVKQFPYSEMNEITHENFTITKENYAVYALFEKLYFDIENINLYEKEEFPFYVETEEEKRAYLEEQEFEKERMRKYNYSNYNELFNPETNTITWYSDETPHEVANYLKIRKCQDTYEVEFYDQPYQEGYDREDNTWGSISVRIRNSGSSYDPFNLIFMRMFNEMQMVDDINDYGHQWHIEEYLYAKNQEQCLQLKKSKKS